MLAQGIEQSRQHDEKRKEWLREMEEQNRVFVDLGFDEE